MWATLERTEVENGPRWSRDRPCSLPTLRKLWQLSDRGDECNVLIRSILWGRGHRRDSKPVCVFWSQASYWGSSHFAGVCSQVLLVLWPGSVADGRCALIRSALEGMREHWGTRGSGAVQHADAVQTGDDRAEFFFLVIFVLECACALYMLNLYIYIMITKQNVFPVSFKSQSFTAFVKAKQFLKYVLNVISGSPTFTS